MNSAYEKTLIRHFFHSQATTQQLAEHLAGPVTHIKALVKVLSCAHSCIRHVVLLLDDFADEPVEGGVLEGLQRDLLTAVLFLGSFFDGLRIMEVARDGDSTSRVNFRITPFKNPRLDMLRTAVNELRSPARPTDALAPVCATQTAFVDFWTLLNFWKHYSPFASHPKADARGMYDIYIPLGGTERSGPVVRQIIVPAFELAVRLAEETALSLSMAPDTILPKDIAERTRFF